MRKIYFSCFFLILFSCAKNSQTKNAGETESAQKSTSANSHILQRSDEELRAFLTDRYSLDEYWLDRPLEQKTIEVLYQKSDREIPIPIDSLNFDSTKIFVSPARQFRIYGIPYLSDRKKFLVIKENLEVGTIARHLIVDINLDENGNGSVETDTDKFDFNEFSLQIEYNGSGLEPMAASICQRATGENTSQCYKREVDEFCTDFWSCAALATNPQIHLLILALCTC